jgi:hypothetical protein
MNLAELAQDQADILIAAGLRATIDARDLNPPAILIRPPVLGYRFGGCNALTWTLIIVVPDSGTKGALSNLGALVDAAQVALGYPAATVTPTDVALLDGGTAPGYTLTYVTKTT